MVSPLKNRMTFLLYCGFIAVIYVIAARIGLSLATLNQNASPVWPATGIAIACLYRSGLKFWPAIFVGAYIANALTGTPILANLGIAMGNTGEAVAGATLIAWISREQTRFELQTRTISYLAASSLAPLISATIGPLSLYLVDIITASQLRSIMVTWWTGDALGALTVAPLILSCNKEEWIELKSSITHGLGSLLIPIAVILLSYFIFHGESGIAFLFLLFPIILWAVAKSSELEVYIISIIIGTIAIYQTVNGHGPFHRGTLNDQLILLQLFLAAISLSAIVLIGFKKSNGFSYASISALLVGWVLSGILFSSFQFSQIERDQQSLATLVEKATLEIHAKIEKIENSIRGGQGLFSASKSVERHEWQNFVKSLRIHEKSGVLGLGVIFRVSESDEDQYIQRVRRDDAPNFKLHLVPPTTHAKTLKYGEHYVITMIEPISDNAPALGLDIGSEENRRAAADLARDTGKSAITRQITLVQAHRKGPGFLYLSPLYQTDAPIDTVDQRRRAHLGWIYSPFVAEDLIRNSLNGLDSEILLSLRDSKPGSDTKPVFRSSQIEAASEKSAALQTKIIIGQREFIADWWHHPAYAQSTDLIVACAAFIGSILTLLMVGFIVSFQSIGRRAQQIADQKTKIIRDRESELIGAKEAALAGIRSRSEFLANMSHEIRTPLNGIIGMTDLMMETSLSPQQKKYSKIIQESGTNLLTIINDILDFSKIEAGKLALEILNFDVSTTVENQAELLGAKAREKNIELSTFIDPKIPSLLKGDPGRIAQVLLNLIGNAIKFTNHGTIKVCALLKNRDANNVNIEFSITDSGIGISKDILNQLFKPFSQADSSTSRKFGGTGLGLSICKQLVELMGGTIGVESEHGVGSRFWFSLPLVIANQRTLLDLAVEASNRDINKLKVLFVDDDPIARDIFSTYLGAWKIQNNVCQSGAEALKVLNDAYSRAEPFDIVITDKRMPEMDGFGLVESIKRDFGFQKLPKFVLATAHDRSNQREGALASGFSAYLTKPVKQSELYNTIIEVSGLAADGKSESLLKPLGESVPTIHSDSPRILVAEDNSANQILILTQLKKLGYFANTVASGFEAIEAFKTGNYHLILMDCQMPEMDGYEATKEIRILEQGTNEHIPIIALTANALEGDEKKCLDSGMDDYISKPFKRDRLGMVLEKWIMRLRDQKRS